MLNIIILSILLASATAKPRSKGEPLQVSLPAQSGSAYQYINPVNVQPSPNPSVAPQPQAGALFQVDPITQEIRQVNPAGQVPGQQPFQGQFVPQPTYQNPEAQGSLISPIPGAVPVPATTNFQQPSVVPQSNYQQPPIPQAVPVQPQSPANFQGTPTQLRPLSPSVPVPQVNPVQPVISNEAIPQPTANQQPYQNTLRQIPVAPLPSNALPPQVEIVRRLIGNPPGGALLVGTNPPLFPIEKRLISNYTKLRANVVDTFRCASSQPGYTGYGYYADVANDCQIFHICLPWKELYPLTFQSDVTYQFSFICPNQTVFSQDVLTCTYRSEAINCGDSPNLYWLNDNFFRKVAAPGGFGTKYANVNEPTTPKPLVYDYYDFNPAPVAGVLNPAPPRP